MTTVYGVGVKRGSTCLLPEISASLSHVSYRDSEAFGIFRINDSAIPSDDVSTIDILHTIFLQISSHEKHLLSASTSQCFPLAGVSHLTECNKKPRVAGTPGLSFSTEEKDRGRWSVAERRMLIILLICECKYTTQLI